MNKTQEESWIWLFLGLPCFLIPGGVAVFIAYDRGLVIFTFVQGLASLIQYSRGGKDNE